MHQSDKQKAAKAHTRKSLEIYYEFQFRSLVQTGELLTKGVAYYFTILAAIGGYLYTAKLPLVEQRLLVIVSLIVSTLFAFIMIVVGYGVLKGIGQMERTLAKYNSNEFEAIAMPQYFRRGKIVGIMVALCCLGILFVIASTFAIKIYA
ncbi:hypothetical protein SAMN05216339_101339 [Nitrosomonas eutropha]|uniref:Uncharacterized protein n=1 Tax=Nitrosomonas eutropha TaxID=916 RepID=A0A1I7F7Y6_9PROT|nr:hypothetical protein [Nitrosomonas eutropha]SFU32274.1 hypothetical protein SAMN05216339_101339 [Nitrosomonas eutropha]